MAYLFVLPTELCLQFCQTAGEYNFVNLRVVNTLRAFTLLFGNLRGIRMDGTKDREGSWRG